MFCFSSNQKLTLAQQQLQADYEKLKAEEVEKSNKLQELMSVDNTNYKRSILCSDNKSLYNLKEPFPVCLNDRSKPTVWEEFLPYKTKRKSVPEKKRKDALNNLAKFTSKHPLSIFHIHTLHFHLIISLTLLLVTHKCPPQFLIVL